MLPLKVNKVVQRKKERKERVFI